MEEDRGLLQNSKLLGELSGRLIMRGLLLRDLVLVDGSRRLHVGEMVLLLLGHVLVSA
jgi:hypothetical protein